MKTKDMIRDMVTFGQKCGTTWFWNFSDQNPNDLTELKTAQEDGAVACMVGLYGSQFTEDTIRFHVLEGWKDAWRTLFRHETDHGQKDMNAWSPVFHTDPETLRITKLTWGLRRWTARWDGEDVDFYLLSTTQPDVPFCDRTLYHGTRIDATPLDRIVDLEDPWVSEA